MFGKKINVINEDGQCFGSMLVRCEQEFSGSYLLDWEEDGDENRGPWGYPQYSDVWSQELGGWLFASALEAEEACRILEEDRYQYSETLQNFIETLAVE
jgi:hypothetical protein